MQNIKGEFFIELLGQRRAIRATFGAAERLEGAGGLSNRSIIATLNNMLTANVRIGDLIAIVEAGLEAARNDTRFTREQIGEHIVDAGIQSVLPSLIEYLTYFITGGNQQKKEEKADTVE